MGLSRDQAWAQLCAWTPSSALRYHARAVELAMRAAAEKHGGDPEQWGLAGMLHDADYEQWPTEHPAHITAWLREQGEPALAHAVSAHYTKWGVPCESLLDRGLLACDELTGFIGACCLVRPGGIHTLEARSVKKKLKDKSFAASVERTEIAAGIAALGVELDAHIELIITALRPHADELGLLGRPPEA